MGPNASEFYPHSLRPSLRNVYYIEKGVRGIDAPGVDRLIESISLCRLCGTVSLEFVCQSRRSTSALHDVTRGKVGVRCLHRDLLMLAWSILPSF